MLSFIPGIFLILLMLRMLAFKKKLISEYKRVISTFFKIAESGLWFLKRWLSLMNFHFRSYYDSKKNDVVVLSNIPELTGKLKIKTAFILC